MAALPVAASRTMLAVSAPQDFSLCGVESALSDVLGCIALRAREPQFSRPEISPIAPFTFTSDMIIGLLTLTLGNRGDGRETISSSRSPNGFQGGGPGFMFGERGG